MTAKSAEFDLNLSQRLYRALTTGKEDLYQVLQDPAMEVLGALLKNPALDQLHLLALLKRRDLSEEVLRGIHRLAIVAESHELKVALAHNPHIPAPVLARLLPHLYLFELVNLCLLACVTPDQKTAAERAVIQRLPGTQLGNKLTLARRGTALLVETLLKEGDPRLMEACLDNPHLKESAIFTFLNGASASAETISTVARHSRWKHRANIRLAILRNIKAPEIWFNVFLPQLSLSDLKGLLLSNRLAPPRKKLVQDELTKRKC